MNKNYSSSSGSEDKIQSELSNIESSTLNSHHDTSNIDICQKVEEKERLTQEEKMSNNEDELKKVQENVSTKTEESSSDLYKKDFINEDEEEELDDEEDFDPFDSLRRKKRDSFIPDGYFGEYLKRNSLPIKKINKDYQKYVIFANEIDGDVFPEIKEIVCEKIAILSGLRGGDSSSAEKYLDNIQKIPYNTKMHNSFDIKEAFDIIDSSHYGMKEVKSKIKRFIASRAHSGSFDGAVICLHGQPGTGKTSISSSIAKALGREFFNISVPALLENVDVVGINPTYKAAEEGIIARALITTHSMDPVILLDELDKARSENAINTPLPALLRLLDPVQNKSFQDMFLDVPIDCSKILFIVTVNDLKPIPRPLLNRMCVIDIDSYSDEEKLEIAKGFVIPKILKKEKLSKKELSFTDEALKEIISKYSTEPGIRTLERNIETIAESHIYNNILSKNIEPCVVTKDKVVDLLKHPEYEEEKEITVSTSGMALGLSVSSIEGGKVGKIEVLDVPGDGKLNLTGNLKDIAKESAEVAFTWVKHHFSKDSTAVEYFKSRDFFLHMPDASSEKDGPSAGIAFALAFYSLYTKEKTKAHLASTGEVDLLGNVTAIGGLKEKIIGAKKSGITDIIIPKENEVKLKDIDKSILKGLKIHPVSKMEEAIKLAF